MIKNIRTAELCLGKKIGNLTASEKKFRSAQRSVVSKRNITKGELLTEANITTMRPALENSIPAAEFYSTLNKIAKREIKEGCVVYREDVES